jgi:hypothetical protein
MNVTSKDLTPSSPLNDWFFDRDSAKLEYRRFIDETEQLREKGLGAMREHVRLRLEELDRESVALPLLDAQQPK